ncbi:hypothetical protein FPV67DRAFT_1743934 [Lyophyllum atratum]|nr:hypothetical protein FPV67DRAFT_1743934 [Lyophyllum atratum]
MHHHADGEAPTLVALEADVAEDGRRYVLPSLYISPTAWTAKHILSGPRAPVNHVLIQHYRSGKDCISEHSDKTINVIRGSNIMNVSAQRVMSHNPPPQEYPPEGGADVPIRYESRTEQAASRRYPAHPSLHISMFVMGPATNTQWLHGTHDDNRPASSKSEAELFQRTERISLTFRHIGVFLTEDGGKTFGYGAKGKTRGEVHPMVFCGERVRR